MISDPRPTLASLRDRHHFDLVDLADEAETHESIVLAMLRGLRVYRMQAGKVLRALSRMTGENYNLENVRVSLFEEGPEAVSHMSLRPTLKEVCKQHSITFQQLLFACIGMNPHVVQFILDCGTGTAEDIDRVLAAVSRLTHSTYSRENVGGFTLTPMPKS